MQFLGRRFDTGQPIAVETSGPRIARVALRDAPAADMARWPWIGPALVDLQVNGWGGAEFASLACTPETVARIVDSQAPFGVARLCPTLTTQGRDVLVHGLRQVAAACRQSPRIAHAVVGIHLEGPYLSPEDGPRGAHPAAHIRPPDWDEFQRFQEAAEGRIRIVTLSPEYEESLEFIARAAASGVIVSIGHTAARPEQIRRAVDAGARMSTHLGNGSHPTMPRHSNYLWAQLADDRLTAGLICDGFHLPPYVVQTLLRAKTAARCFLVSDVVSLAGLPPGRYDTGLCPTEVLPSGKLVIAGQHELLAGASLPLSAGVANVMGFAGLDLAEAVHLASTNPARAVGLAPVDLKPGDSADLCVFRIVDDAGLSGGRRMLVETTVAAGEVLHAVA